MSRGPGGNAVPPLPPGSYDMVAHVHGYPPHLFAGAEFMLHTMLRRLVDDGMTVLVTTPRYKGLETSYSLDGIDVVTTKFWGTTVDHVRHAKVVVSHLGMHPKSWKYARLMQKPLIVVAHNDMDGTRQHFRTFPPDLMVWNTEWVRDSVTRGRVDFDDDVWIEDAELPADVPGIVIHPPVMLDEYRTTPGDMVTLINHNADKGGHVFQALAARMPERKFLAQTGSHGPQVCAPAHNLEVAPGTMNIRDDVYARTRVLLMPSVYESYGRTAVEAMASGIPVIANPTPGLREAMGPTGIFVARDDMDGWVDAIRALDDPGVYAAASRAALARAAELDPTDGLNRWASAVADLIGGGA